MLTYFVLGACLSALVSIRPNRNTRMGLLIALLAAIDIYELQPVIDKCPEGEDDDDLYDAVENSEGGKAAAEPAPAGEE
jgi:hypothetical protein